MGDEVSMAEDLAMAWDASEEETEETTDDNTEDQQPELAADTGVVDDTDGGPEELPDESADAPVVQASEEGSVSEDGADPDKPPVGLSPTAREAWKDTPKVVQDEIRKREKDYESGVMKYAENAKRAEAMDRTLAPHQQLFAMNGGVAQVMPGLLQTASLLQMGSPQQKAQQVMALIKQFGVDIRTLDNILVGQAPPVEVQQGQQVQQQVDARMQQYQQQQQQHQQQQNQAQVTSEVEAFAADPKNEFYRDVSPDMADLMDMAGNRGQQMSLPDAYKKACQLHPQIGPILTARGNQTSTQRKRNAAASIHGSPGGPGGDAAPGSTRAALEDAWANAGQM